MKRKTLCRQVRPKWFPPWPIQLSPTLETGRPRPMSTETPKSRPTPRASASANLLSNPTPNRQGSFFPEDNGHRLGATVRSVQSAYSLDRGSVSVFKRIEHPIPFFWFRFNSWRNWKIFGFTTYSYQAMNRWNQIRFSPGMSLAGNPSATHAGTTRFTTEVFCSVL